MPIKFDDHPDYGKLMPRGDFLAMLYGTERPIKAPFDVRLCQCCGSEFRPAMPKYLGLFMRDTDAMPSAWLCLACAYNVSDLSSGQIRVAVASSIGTLFIYRGPASHLEEWCRQIDRVQKG